MRFTRIDFGQICTANILLDIIGQMKQMGGFLATLLITGAVQLLLKIIEHRYLKKKE